MTFPRRLAVALSFAYVSSLVLVAVRLPAPTIRGTSDTASSTITGAEAFRMSFGMTTELGKAEDAEDYVLAFAWVANLPLIATLIVGLRRGRAGGEDAGFVHASMFARRPVAMQRPWRRLRSPPATPAPPGGCRGCGRSR